MFYDDDNAANAQSPTTSWNGNINSTVADYKFADAINISDLADFATPTTYAYTYDGINRLTVADAHGVKAGQANLGDVTYSYDKIGNLETLNRKIWDAPSNSLQTQNYNYRYYSTTNRLKNVQGNSSVRYTYDTNGNMVSDTDKNLDNTLYGRANLPYQLDLNTGNQINYQYNASDMRLYKKVDSLGTILKEEYYLRDATGRELAVIDNDYNVNWYIYGKERVASMRHQLSVGMSNLFITGNIPDGLHYAPNELRTDGTVQSADEVILQAGECVFMDEGFSTPVDADFTAEIKTQPIPEFVYYLYDHLGNTRVTYSVDLYVDVGVDAVQVRRTVESATDYYPYGKALRSYGRERYQSTYHERDVESGFDYRGARFYDGDVVRFNSLDPLAADFASWSPYNYVMGNPLMLIDADGRNPEPPKVYLVDFTGLDMDVISGHVRDIYAKNGIEIDIEIITPEQGWEINHFDEEEMPISFGVGIVDANNTTNGPYPFLSFSSINENYGNINLVWKDYENDQYYASSYVTTTRFKQQVNSGADFDLDYAIGYMAAHEILHQMLFRAARDLGKTLSEISSPDSDGVHFDREPNLNREAPKTKIPKAASKKLRPQETILSTNGHKDMIECYCDKILTSDKTFLR